MNIDYSLLLIIMIVLITIAITLLIREIVCWYLKINKRVKLQRATLETMLKIYEQNGGNVDWEEMNKLYEIELIK